MYESTCFLLINNSIFSSFRSSLKYKVALPYLNTKTEISLCLLRVLKILKTSKQFQNCKNNSNDENLLDLVIDKKA